MSTKIRLYFSNLIKSDLLSQLNKGQSHYLKDVMRLKLGENFTVFNEKGEWDAVVISYENGIAKIKIKKKIREENSTKNIWLAFSLIKKSPLDFMIQKSTELGIHKFIPILSDRSIVRDINLVRTKKIIVEASEQSNRLTIPQIDDLKSLKNFLLNFPKDAKLIFCDIDFKKNNLQKILSEKSISPVCILIGPEGDFSEKEKQSIIDMKQSFSLSLGSNILRAETAAIAAISIVNFHL